MNFSEDWDERYREGTHWSVWPWSDLVSLVRRHCKHLTCSSRVLELGCGAGANIPFFESIGVRYYAIDGSRAIVRHLQERFPSLASGIVVGDFTTERPFEPGFDLVVDRAALTHNATQAIASGLRLAWEQLRSGGYFIGVDWFSTRHSQFLRGQPDADPHTRRGYPEGPFTGTGRVHFSDEGHLRELFARFELVYLEEKVIEQRLPLSNEQLVTWNVVARRPDG